MFERFTKQIDTAVIRWKNLSIVIRQKCFVRIDVFLRELRCSFLEILTTRWPCYKNERQVAIDWYENRVENFFPNEMDGRSVLILYLIRFAVEDILFIGRFRIRWKNLSLVIGRNVSFSPTNKKIFAIALIALIIVSCKKNQVGELNRYFTYAHIRIQSYRLSRFMPLYSFHIVIL